MLTVLAILSGVAMADPIEAPSHNFPFQFNFPGITSGQTDITFTGSEDLTTGSDCNKGWASGLCLSGTFTTGDGGMGTFETWATKSGGTSTVRQHVTWTYGGTGTTYLGSALVNVPDLFSGTAQSGDGSINGTWTELISGSLVASVQGPPNARSRRNGGPNQGNPPAHSRASSLRNP